MRTALGTARAEQHVQIGVPCMVHKVGTVAEGTKADDVPSVAARTFYAVTTPVGHSTSPPDVYDYIPRAGSEC
jgi:hypothetical protein